MAGGQRASAHQQYLTLSTPREPGIANVVDIQCTLLARWYFLVPADADGSAERRTIPPCASLAQTLAKVATCPQRLLHLFAELLHHVVVLARRRP